MPAAQYLPQVPCTSQPPFSLSFTPYCSRHNFSPNCWQTKDFLYCYSLSPASQENMNCHYSASADTWCSGSDSTHDFKTEMVTLSGGSWAHRWFNSLPTCNDTWYKPQQWCTDALKAAQLDGTEQASAISYFPSWLL